jgi:hypothetical protein
MINNNGVQPTRAMIAPILKSQLFKYCFIAFLLSAFAAVQRRRARAPVSPSATSE